MQGLSVRIARGLNRWWKRAGRVLGDRYHDQILKSPREVWNALKYVLNNARKHGAWLVRGMPDPYSSGESFEGWVERGPGVSRTSHSSGARGRARTEPHTWLLGAGWRRHGPIGLDATPSS
jgi:hypothetical protein